MTLEVVPLKCASRQEKTPLRVPISTACSSKMQLNVGEKRSTPATVKIMSGENWRELRPCGYPYSPREAAAQFTASQETTARNCREFRPRQRLFSVPRPHSTQQSKKQSKKISEKSAHADDYLPPCIGRTVFRSQRSLHWPTSSVAGPAECAERLNNLVYTFAGWVYWTFGRF